MASGIFCGHPDRAGGGCGLSGTHTGVFPGDKTHGNRRKKSIIKKGYIHSQCSAVSFALCAMFPISDLLYKYFQVSFPVDDRVEGWYSKSWNRLLSGLLFWRIQVLLRILFSWAESFLRLLNVVYWSLWSQKHHLPGLWSLHPEEFWILMALVFQKGNVLPEFFCKYGKRIFRFLCGRNDKYIHH